jgi:sugar O-acyltransferase (sialic acid O-acetyltransferase NeuD family)
MSIEVIVAGASGSGLKVLQILEDRRAQGQEDIKIYGFFDDNEELWGKEFFGYPVFGDIAEINKIRKNKRIGIVCPIGNPINRYKMIERFNTINCEFPNAIHPSAQVSAKAQVGIGNVISQNVVVQAGVSIGNFNTFNIASILGPLAQVRNFCTVNATVMIASQAVVKDYSYIGMGAKIKEKITISKGSTVGANAFVNSEHEAWSIMVGLPAKVIKRNKQPI